MRGWLRGRCSLAWIAPAEVLSPGSWDQRSRAAFGALAAASVLGCAAEVVAAGAAGEPFAGGGPCAAAWATLTGGEGEVEEVHAADAAAGAVEAAQAPDQAVGMAQEQERGRGGEPEGDVELVVGALAVGA